MKKTASTNSSSRRRSQKKEAPGRTVGADASPTRRISDQLLLRIGPKKYDKWFGHATMCVEDSGLHIRTDSRFVANWIGTHFHDELHGIVTQTLGADAGVRVEVDNDQPTQGGTKDNVVARIREEDEQVSPRARREPARPQSSPKKKGPNNLLLRNLDDFIVGDGNQLAFEASRRIATDADGQFHSPLFVHGECGLGKTHLLQGIARLFQKNNGSTAKMRYLTGEQFTNEYIAAVRGAEIERFRSRIRRLDLLIIDDVHFLSNKMRTQSELLHTLDAIDMAGGRVVLASDSHPRQIRSFKQALTSRFMSGMVVQLCTPDRATRGSIVHHLASRRGLKISDGAVDLVSGHCVGSVRELEGAVTKLSALHALSDQAADAPIGATLAQQVFQDHAWQSSSPVRMATVVDVVCDRLSVSKADLIGTRRHRRVVLARAVIAHLGRVLTTHSYPEIAQALGRTYHSTVHTAAHRLRRQLEADESITFGTGEKPRRLRELVDQLRHEIVRVGA